MEKPKNTNYQYIEILYNNIKINQFQYENTSMLKNLKFFIFNTYNIPYEQIVLTYNKNILKDDEIILSKVFMTSLKKISGEKINVRVIPQVHMINLIMLVNFNFIPYDEINNFDEENINIKNENMNDENIIKIQFDLLITKVNEFKQRTYELFTEKMNDFNYHLDHNNSEFYYNNKNYKLIFENLNNINNLDETPICKFFVKNELPMEVLNFYYIIINSSIHLFFNKSNNEVNNNLDNKKSIELRKIYFNGHKFKIILQTYNSNIRELEVYAEMTISELKDLIENILGIKKNYQELLYLVYKLKEDDKTLKEYYIRPSGIIFLRGFYFPLIFSDYYDKKISNILRINLAEKISKIKEEIINRLNLKFENFKLICNGRELDDEKYLIDYNILKNQIIYIK